ADRAVDVQAVVGGVAPGVVPDHQDVALLVHAQLWQRLPGDHLVAQGRVGGEGAAVVVVVQRGAEAGLVRGEVLRGGPGGELGEVREVGPTVKVRVQVTP